MTAPGFDGSIKIDSSINTSGFNNGIKSMTGMLKGLAVSIGLAFGVTAVVNFGKAAVDSAKTIQAAYIGLESIVKGNGQSFNGAKAFIQSYIADGLVPAANAVTAYKNLLMRGYNTDQIQKAMIALKNSSAFGRQASLTMGQAVQSATEGLKNENSILVDNAGVTKNVSMMWKDYAEKIGVGVQSLTKAQKIEAEMAGIVEETRFQMGDAAKLAGTYSGQVSALSVSFTNLKVAIGNSIIPIITALLPAIRSMIDTLTAFFTQVAALVALFFGIQSTTDQTASNLDAAAASAGELMDNLTGSNKAAKGALASFDQLNVLQQGDKSAPSTTPSIPLPALDTTPITTGLGEASQKLLDFKNSIVTLFQPAIDAFNRLSVALAPFGKAIWEGLKWAWDNILVPLGKWVISEVLPRWLDLSAAGAQVLNDVLTVLKPVWDWIWTNMLLPAGKFVGDALLRYLELAGEAFRGMHQWILQNNDAFKVVIAGIGLLILALILLVSPVAGVVLGIIALIAVIILLVQNWGLVKTKAAEIWESIKQTWGTFATWFKTNVTDKFVAAWNAGVLMVKTIWFELVRWFDHNFTIPIRNRFVETTQFIQRAWENTFNGIANFIRGTINTIIDFMNGMLFAISTGINTVIDGINSISITIPEWVPLIGGSTWSTNIPLMSAPQIPRLATGAVIPPNSQFMAVLGDQKSGTNIEAPEGLIRQIVSEEIGKISADIKIGFTGNMSQLVRELRPFIEKENVRVGSSLIKSGTTI